MRAYAPRLNSWRKADPRPTRRERRAERHSMRQRARRALLAGLLSACIALPVRAEVPPATEGRKVDLKEGAAAPFTGALVDDAYARVLLERRRTAELAAEKALAVASEKDAALASCEESRTGWQPVTVAALVAAALALGIVGGVYLGATASK